MDPNRPSQLSEFAAACLEAVARAGLGRAISVGGAVGLSHYIEYRPTKDLDAWWAPSASTQEREHLLQTIEEVLRPFGKVARRAWGEVVSVELRREASVVFSFQIAERTAQLRAPAPAPGLDVLIDSLPDLLASKMVALVERGAPRDFRDIHAVCTSGVSDPGKCWALWRERQGLAGADADTRRARVAIETHLERIEKHRPIAAIVDPAGREEARAVREWYRKEFLHGVRD